MYYPPNFQVTESLLSPHQSSSALLEGVDDLLRPFHDAFTAREHFRVGMEAEKFGVLARNGVPIPFEGSAGVTAVLQKLVRDHGWTASSEYAGGPVISLTRNGTSITLEPAGQLELSGAPHDSIHAIRAELDAHVAEIKEVGAALGIRWLSVGYHPTARDSELPHVPKLRYAVMERYLPTRGSRAIDMMRRTATVQANLDYSDAADAVRKLRVALAVQPIVTAMFANSPFVEGSRGPRLCERAEAWLHMDPDRSGLLPFAWHEDMSLERYVEWALDAPMFMLKRDGRALEIHETFRRFLRDGAHGTRATMDDWTAHLNSLFPEARLKSTLEVRGADAQDQQTACALPALWKGLLYDEASLAGLEDLVSSLDHDSVQAARPEIARVGPRARLAGRPIVEWSRELYDLAAAGLSRLATLDAEGNDERLHLKPLGMLLGADKCPADVLVERVDASADLSARIIAVTAL